MRLQVRLDDALVEVLVTDGKEYAFHTSRDRPLGQRLSIEREDRGAGWISLFERAAVLESKGIETADEEVLRSGRRGENLGRHAA